MNDIMKGRMTRSSLAADCPWENGARGERPHVEVSGRGYGLEFFGATFRVKKKVAPSPGVLSSQILPP